MLFVFSAWPCGLSWRYQSFLSNISLMSLVLKFSRRFQTSIWQAWVIQKTSSQHKFRPSLRVFGRKSPPKRRPKQGGVSGSPLIKNGWFGKSFLYNGWFGVSPLQETPIYIYIILYTHTHEVVNYFLTGMHIQAVYPCRCLNSFFCFARKGGNATSRGYQHLFLGISGNPYWTASWIYTNCRQRDTKK